MHESASLIATIAVGLGLALVLGFAAVRLKLPALVGYLLAGMVIGPATPGFVADMELSYQLSEIGVMLLMFGVGLHFSFEDLLTVRKIALPGAVVQIAVATAMGASVASLWGWSLGASVVFGLSLSVASTVVLVRALEDREILDTVNGRIAVGWLVVEDLAMVLALVLLPALAGWLKGEAIEGGGEGLITTLGITLGKVSLFVAFMLVVGKRLFPWLLLQVSRTGSRELFTLCVTVAAVSIAYGATMLFGVSFALGAFFAGMVMRESHLSFRAAEETLPLREAFAVLFFVSVGMLFDPNILLHEPLKLMLVIGIIVLGKTVAAFAIVLLFRYPLNTALTVSASLAQIGEFSFILAGLGVALDLLPMEGNSYILAGAIISIALNPLLFRAIDPLYAWIRSRSELARVFERPDDPLAQLPMTIDASRLTGHVLIAGYGRVGQRIADILVQRGVPIVVAEQNREAVERLRARNIPAVSGDAAEPAVLIQAHVARAAMLVIAIPDTFRAQRMIEIARTLNPDVAISVRTHSDEEAAVLEKEKVAGVFMGERELADSMARHAIEQLLARPAAPNRA